MTSTQLTCRAWIAADSCDAVMLVISVGKYCPLDSADHVSGNASDALTPAHSLINCLRLERRTISPIELPLHRYPSPRVYCSYPRLPFASTDHRAVQNNNQDRHTRKKGVDLMRSYPGLESLAAVHRVCALASLLVLGLSSTAARNAHAQVLMQPNISVAQARLIVDTIITECSTSDELVTVTIAVVDRMGLPVMQVRADTASPHNWELAFRKAYTARTFRRTSLSLRDRYLSEPTITGQRVLSNIVALGGGVPIMMGDVPIGAVGVSGAVGGQESDTACAQMGIDAISDQLE
jgi:uncharacterized protein GlcG (DUF336 family)